MASDLSPPRYRQILEMFKMRISSGECRPGEKLPTEADLMRRFDVSRTTVSRAMRDLELIGLVIRRRGSGTYVRQPQETERLDLAFFVPWVETDRGLPYVEGLIYQHLADLAGRCGSTLSLNCAAPSGEPMEDRVLEATDALIDNGVNGVLYYPAELPANQMALNRQVIDRLMGAGVQVVLIDRDIVPFPQRSEFTRIGYDNRRGGVLLTDHLIQRGCRRIAFVGIPEVSTVVANRLCGYYEAHRAHGLEVDPALVRMADEIDLTEPFCRDLIREARPDAIIGKMDRYAALIGRHLMAMNVVIGKEIKLAGFDDDPIAELLPVPLTTIRLPVQSFARTAFQAIRRRVLEPETDVTQIIIDTELVVRGSTCL
jgi:GntR family transcriptional regulator of arabinose operon